MVRCSAAAGSLASSYRGQLPSAVPNPARVVVIHSSTADAHAQHIVAEMRGVGHEPVSLKIGRTLVERVVAGDPDVVLVIRAGDSFDLVRVCADLHETLACRIVVIDFEERPAADGLVIETLQAGADDFIAFTSAAVMLARIRVALRARPLRAPRSPRIRVGDVVIDLEAHAVHIDGVAVNCPPRQFDVLVALASRPNEMVRRDALIAEVWRVAPESIDSRRVRIAISVLRGVLGTGPGRPLIESVSRIGYRLAMPSPAASE
jgi:two-component system response regulator MtrA